MSADRPPTASEWSLKLKEAQATGSRAATLELSGSFDAAFSSYIKAAQAYLFLIRHTQDGEVKTRLRGVSSKLLERAERIKKARKVGPVMRDRMALEEQDLVLETAAFLEGLRLPRWTAQDALPSLPSPSISAQPALAPAQIQARVDWRRAVQALPDAAMVRLSVSGKQIVQDNLTDCSLVAALIVGAEHHSKFGSKLAMGCLYPQDSHGMPVRSDSGIYKARFLVNGAWRCISIDDYLPVSEDGRLFCASTSHQCQLWPALVEKAYMKLNGGYDFKGSALSGWIPERISLNTQVTSPNDGCAEANLRLPLSGGYQSEKTWMRLLDGVRAGHCVVTIGTGQDPSRSFSPTGLIPTHNYAVIDLRERDGRRELELVNPWRASAGPLEQLSDFVGDLNAALSGDDSRSLIVDWEVISSPFDALYLNWDPALFENSDAVHCCIKKAPTTPASSASSSQFRLRLDQKPSALPSEIWLLLSRHQRTKADPDEFLGVSVARSWGTEMGLVDTTRVDGTSTLVDTPHVLYRFNSDPDTSLYDIFVSHRGPSEDLSFSLRAYSSLALKIEDGPKQHPYSTTLRGKWVDQTAGGNHTCRTFMSNPQYRITLSPLPGQPNGLADLHVVCETSRELPVNAKIVRSGGERISHFEQRDVVAGTASYSYGIASCQSRDLKPGVYTLVVSTFLPAQEGEFSLNISSTLPLEASLLPQEGAGMFSRIGRGAWTPALDGGSQDLLQNPSFALAVSRTTNINVRLQIVDPLSTPIALSVFAAREDGTPGALVESTGPYSDVVGGVVTRLFRLSPSEHGYIVVPSTFSSGVHADFEILLYADQPVTLSRRS